MADQNQGFVIPQGNDYADGKTLIPAVPFGSSGSAIIGTKNPTGEIVEISNGGNELIQEEDGSPEMERAEQCTVSHNQIMPENDAWYMLGGLQRGTFVADSAGDKFRILSSKVTRIGKSMPGFARLTTVSESISFDTPPDDFWIESSDMGLNIIKNPRYFTNLWPTSNNLKFGGINDFVAMVGAGGQTATVAQVKMAIIRAVQTYQDSPFYPSSNTINGQVQNNIIQMFVSGIVPVQVGASTNSVTIAGTDTAAAAACQLAIAAAGEVIQNIWYSNDTPYAPIFEIHWVTHWFYSPYLNPGCYIEDPMLVIPDYFTDPASSQSTVPNTGSGNENPGDGSSTIFDDFASINPQYFSNDGTTDGTPAYSALRKADTVRFQRTWFDLDASWIVAPIGAWNPYIFSGGERPTQPTDYEPLQ